MLNPGPCQHVMCSVTTVLLHMQCCSNSLCPASACALVATLQPTREVVRPPNQLQLTEAELAEEMAKMLTANNPAAPQNVARFNMKERCYKFDPMVEQVVVHYGNDGWLLHKAGEEARRQAEAEKAEAEAAAKFQAELERALREKEAGADVEPPDDSRQLRNQFNFSERAVQTFTYPLRDRATYTEPPPTATVSGVWWGSTTCKGQDAVQPFPRPRCMRALCCQFPGLQDSAVHEECTAINEFLPAVLVWPCTAETACLAEQQSDVCRVQWPSAWGLCSRAPLMVVTTNLVTYTAGKVAQHYMTTCPNFLCLAKHANSCTCDQQFSSSHLLAFFCCCRLMLHVGGV
jgi:hypothetical protein